MKFREVTDADIRKWLEDDQSKLKHKVTDTYHQIKKVIEQKKSMTTIDFHGMTLECAHGKLDEFLDYHYGIKTNCVTIITGKSGSIFIEFPKWIQKYEFVRSYSLLRNKGSWKVTFRI